MNKLILVCLLFVSFFCNAQNYNPLQYGIKRYFTNGNGYLRGIRVDSVTVSGSDTVFHLFHTVRSAGYFSLSDIPVRIDTAGGSWAGGNVIKQADGTFLFDNLWGDTVVVKTQAVLGDSWTFFDDTTQISYTATVTAIDTMTILGVLDSVKTITISADTAGAPYVSDPVNGFQLKLSCNNGFVQAFDLYTFPYHLPDSLSDIIWIDYYLDLVIGRGNGFGNDQYLIPGPYHDWQLVPDTVNSIFKLVNFHNPRTLEFVGFAAGDVWEWQDVHSSGGGAYVDNYDYVDTVTSASITPWSRSYSANGHYSLHNMPYDTYSTGPSLVTGAGDTSLLINEDLMPEERGGQYYYNYFPNASPDSGLCNISGMYVINTEHIASNGTVIYGEHVDMGWSFYDYIDTYYGGFGKWSIYSYDLTLLQTHNMNISYVSMGGAVCYGAFRWLDGVNQVPNTIENIKLYPNPAERSVTVSLPGTKCFVSVTDIMGQQLFHFETDQDKLDIDVSSFVPGIYSVTISDESGKTVVRKLSVLH